jgi:prepilin-type N-terminal cleavage/methylation domain-containing protein
VSSASRVRERLSSESGYSLIELLMVLMILGTVIGALVTVFVDGSNAEANINSRFQAQLNARLALDKLRREVHCASAVTPTAATPTQSVTVTLPTPAAGASPCPSGSGAFTWRTCSVSASRYAFFRIPGTDAACGAAGAVRWADYLVTAEAFPSPTIYAATSTSRARLHVSLSVNPRPTKPGTYTLTDDLVLRNSGNPG